jgi:hypothetical protein
MEGHLRGHAKSVEIKEIEQGGGLNALTRASHLRRSAKMRDETADVYARVHHRVDEILHYIWDPIGVSGIAEARDEYDSYVPQLVRMLFNGKEEKEIARFLYSIESDRMGLTVGSRPSDHTEEVAATLVHHYDVIRKRA